MKDINVISAPNGADVLINADDLVERYDSGSLPCYDIAKLVHDYAYDYLKSKTESSFVRFTSAKKRRYSIDYVAKVIGAGAVIGLSMLVPCTPEVASRIKDMLKEYMARGENVEIAYGITYTRKTGRTQALEPIWFSAVLRAGQGERLNRNTVRLSSGSDEQIAAWRYTSQPLIRDARIEVSVTSTLDDKDKPIILAEVAGGSIAPSIDSTPYAPLVWRVAHKHKNSITMVARYPELESPVKFAQLSSVISL